MYVFPPISTWLCSITIILLLCYFSFDVISRDEFIINMSESNNKRIAKNTLFLYFRMFLTMTVSLYTSRVILRVLGVEDYGIFNVVGGVIAMLGFLNSSLSGASSRFLTYELGKGTKGRPQKIFSTILCIHFILAIIVIIIGETFGLWFVHNKLIIPDNRIEAALWVYHCSILTAVISIISVPYNSLIIAREKMNAFAYISIVEVSLKLLIVWLLTLLQYDKLIIYSILLLGVQLFIRLLYNKYCTKHFSESRTMPTYCPKIMKEIFVYASWTMNGYLAVVGYTQGINILLNMFFGPVVNAARGIAVQVQVAVMTFVHNFQTATRPQIIKSYASKDLQYMHSLIIASSKYGFYLMLFITFPILLCLDPILRIWLEIVPEYTSVFVKIMLFTGLFQPLSFALIAGIHATGDIRKFQIFEGTSLLTVVPISYFLLKYRHISPEMVMLVYLMIEIITQGIRVWVVLPKINMKYTVYLKKIIGPLIFPLLTMLLILFNIIVPENLSLGLTILYFFIACLCISFCICILGLTKKERCIVNGYIKNKIKRK